MAWVEGTRGVLLDVDGTLLDGDDAIPGAPEAIARLRARGIALRLTTNTTRRSRREIAAVLHRAGIEVAVEEILIPASLAWRRIVDSGRTRAMLLLPDDSKTDLDGVVEDEQHPDWVVVGDMAEGFTFDRMNRAFLALRNGAQLLALHKNRYWQPSSGTLQIDAGPFVAALEYATGATALVVGKPSPEFFHLALADLGLPASDVIVVGDSVENEGVGAAAAGCRVVFVRTGVFQSSLVESLELRPALVLDSIGDLG
jgi:HAD superfamily hydrolase (TIGR01458 family)